MSIDSVMPSNHLILCCPLLLPPLIFTCIRVLSNESVLHISWSKYWSFSFSISPSNDYSGLISFRMDWLDLHAGQGTLMSLLQYHSSKASIVWHSAFIKRLFSSSSLSSVRVVSSVYLRLLIFLPAVLNPACASSSSAGCTHDVLCL